MTPKEIADRNKEADIIHLPYEIRVYPSAVLHELAVVRVYIDGVAVYNTEIERIDPHLSKLISACQGMLEQLIRRAEVKSQLAVNTLLNAKDLSNEE